MGVSESLINSNHIRRKKKEREDRTRDTDSQIITFHRDFFLLLLLLLLLPLRHEVARADACRVKKTRCKYTLVKSLPVIKQDSILARIGSDRIRDRMMSKSRIHRPKKGILAISFEWEERPTLGFLLRSFDKSCPWTICFSMQWTYRGKTSSQVLVHRIARSSSEYVEGFPAR